jgi:beta-N-acetylhexosaminidase
MVMVGHYALPRITGSDELPSSMSSHIVREVLRDRLGFDGVAITDALDMRALRQGAEQAEVVVAAMRAGIDLLLCTADSAQQDRVRTALGQAVATGELDPERVASATHRVRGLRTWVAPFRQPPLEVVGCGEHRSLARELAERAVTLVRDLDGLLPLRLGPDARVAAVMPRPRDLTPADTSSRVRPALAPALRTRHPRVEEILTSNPPSAGEIAAVRDRLGSFDLAVVGTMDAFRDPRQADLVRAVLGVAVSAVWVALRTPFDLAVVPEARAYACTFGILPPSVEALAAAMFGEIPFPGRLPAAIPGLYPAGSGLPT